MKIRLAGSPGSSRSLAVSFGGFGGGAGGPPEAAGSVSGTFSGEGVNSPRLTTSRDGQQFHLEDQRCVRRNRSGITCRTVRKLRRNREPGFIAHPHGRDALIPTSNDLPGAKRKRKRLTAVH